MCIDMCIDRCIHVCIDVYICMPRCAPLEVLLALTVYDIFDGLENGSV